MAFFVQVLRYEAYVQGTIRLTRVCEGRYPLGRPRDSGDHTFLYHIIECALNMFPVLYRYLLLGMLDRGNGRVSPDGIGPRHVAYCIKGVQEGLL